MSDQEAEQGIVIRHPFRIEHIFFLTIRIQRPERVPPELRAQPLRTEFALGLPDGGKHYNLNLKIRSEPDAKDGLDLEIITTGVFSYLSEGEPSASELTAFFNEQLLVAMTSRIIQQVAMLTSQMGMPPVWFPSPRAFGLDADTVQTLIDTFQPKLDLGES